MASCRMSLARLLLIVSLLTGSLLLLAPWAADMVTGISAAFWLRLPWFLYYALFAYALLLLIALPAAIVCIWRRALLGIVALGILAVLLVCLMIIDSPLNPRVLYTASSSMPDNAILVIAPYRYEGTWVFDDARVGLFREPFVGGVPEMIDVLVTTIPAAEDGFRLTFSTSEFPGYTTKLLWRRKQGGGNWYYSPEYDLEGWICPAMFKYFNTPPRVLYVKADPK